MLILDPINNHQIQKQKTKNKMPPKQNKASSGQQQEATTATATAISPSKRAKSGEVELKHEGHRLLRKETAESVLSLVLRRDPTDTKTMQQSQAIIDEVRNGGEAKLIEIAQKFGDLQVCCFVLFCGVLLESPI